MTFAFSETMRRQMEAKNMAARDVAAKVNWSFEHIRKLCKSEAFPSRPLQKALADLLEIDHGEFERQVNADRWREKYGKIPASNAKSEHPIFTVWDDLSKDQQMTLLCIARCMIRQKKKRSAA